MLGTDVSRRQGLFVTMAVNVIVIVIVAVIMAVTVVARLHEDADA